MKAVVLEEKQKISIRDIKINETLGSDDVRIRIKTVGICGSDLHYYTHGHIGSFIVQEPMVLGHEAAGIVEKVGSAVRHLNVGDRVCMEPGIPSMQSRETLTGHYNVDPTVRFWATPPVHGCLRETVIHPAAFTFKISNKISMEEGALIEPLSIGLHAATVAAIAPGDRALVIGAGTIGLMTALACSAGGCGAVCIADISAERLEIINDHYPHIQTIHVSEKESIDSIVNEVTGGRGFEKLFEATGAAIVARSMCSYVAPNGTIIAIGMPPDGIMPINIVDAQSKEITIKTIFRYVNIYPKAIELLESGKLNLAPLISRKYQFKDAEQAFRDLSTDSSGIIKAFIQM